MRILSRTSLLLLTTALLAPPLAAQSSEPFQRQLYETVPQTSGGFGTFAKGLGDIDGDGFDDYGVAAPGFVHAGGTGRVYLYSGLTGLLLNKLDGDQPSADFGLTLANVGDVNGDGQAEIAVGAPNYDLPQGNNTGRVFLFDSASGAVLWSLDGDSGFANFGESMGAIADTDADGVRELVIGAPRQDIPLGADSGRVYFVRGDSGVIFGFADSPLVWGGIGSTLGTRPEAGVVYAGMSAGAIYSVPVPVAGEVIPVLYEPALPGNSSAAELAVINVGTSGSPRWGLIIGWQYADSNGMVNNGRVELRSAAGAPLLSIDGTAGVQFVGSGVTHVADMDGDGKEEIGLASLLPGGFWYQKWYRVVSQTGTLLDDVERAYGSSVISTLRDLSGDGRGEFLATIFSGVSLEFEATVFAAGLEISSLAFDGIGALNADFEIDLNPVQGGRDYFQIYGFSGAAPGVPNGSPGAPLVPINPDGFSTLFSNLVGTAILPDAAGTLSAGGTASTSIWLPANATAFFSGMEMVTTVISYDPGTQAIFAATNPQVIEIP